MEIRDLGPLLVETDGLPTALGSGRLAAVLSPLANWVGELVSSATLIEAVWGREVPPRANQLLESLVWRLRKQLEPGRVARAEAAVLRRDPQGYRLDLPAVTVDSARIRATLPVVRGLAAGGELAGVLDATAAALSLWRGEPYAGVADTGWLGPARQELTEARLDLAELRVAALLEVGRPEEAISELGPLLADYPFRERLWAQRMTGLYRAGRQADALAAFAAASDVLAEELGVDPGLELRDLQQRILRQDPLLDQRPVAAAAATSGSVQLPRRRTALVGRDEELSRVTLLVADNPLVTLLGPGGVGKTRLAVEVGYAVGASFADGVWFVDLASVGDGALLEVTLVASLGLAERPGRRPIEIVTGFLADRRALLVMDNCEHVVAAAASTVEEILDGCPDVRVLATSRERLDLPDELTYPIDPLPVEAGGGATGSAVALFAERVWGATDIDLGRADSELVRRICVAVGGLPLGIELAAAAVRTFELAEIAEALEQNPVSLSRRGPGARRQASLRDTVDWGYRLARGDEQILHRRLSVIPGPFTLDVAAALCGVPPLQADQPMDLVGGLVHRSLLTSTRPPTPGRLSTFVQLVPVRAHAAEVIAAAERATVASARDHWLARRVAEAPIGGQPGEAAFRDWLDDNSASLRATLDSTLLERPDRAAIGIVGALVGYWFERGRLAEATHWVAQLGMLPERIEADPFDLALIDAATGAVLALQHRGTEAAALLLGCLPALAAAPADRRREAGAALLTGSATAWTGDIWEVSTEYADAAVEFVRTADQPHTLIVARAVRAANLAFAGDRVAGIGEANSVRHDNVNLGNDLADVFALVALTLAALRGGDVDAALGASDALLLTHRRRGTLAVADTIETRAAIRAAAGDTAAAIRCFGAAAALSRRLGRDWPWHEITPGVLANLREQTDPAEFERHWASGDRLGLGDPERFTPDWI